MDDVRDDDDDDDDDDEPADYRIDSVLFVIVYLPISKQRIQDHEDEAEDDDDDDDDDDYCNHEAELK
eukprot:3680692-Amphidinium_carterae.1